MNQLRSNWHRASGEDPGIVSDGITALANGYGRLSKKDKTRVHNYLMWLEDLAEMQQKQIAIFEQLISKRYEKN